RNGGANGPDGTDGFNVTVRGPASENVVDVGAGDSLPPSALTSPLPQWLLSRLEGEREFHGLVVETDPFERRRVHALSAIRLERHPATVFQLSYPLSESLCAHLSHTTDLDVKPATANFPLIMTSRGPQPDLESAELTGGFQGGGWPIFKPIAEWRTGNIRQNEALRVDPSFILPARIYQRIQQFKSGSAIGSAVVFGLGVLVVFFLLITLAAVFYAVVLTRSITGAVHHLYEGTMRVEAGDLDHEIPITGGDQLAGLTRSFNRMTRSIRELLRVSAEKQRLDQEMKIAAAVQSRLFPRSIPKSEKLDIAKGVCIPARSVSGDYYDLLDVAPGVIGIVVADVCGKGVSAALMMANLQANLRSQTRAYQDAYENGGRPLAMNAHPARRVVERVNRQVAGSMMDASFITLFYAEFDERTSTLRYANAGHNPPLLLRNEKSGVKTVKKLHVGGTVLGVFCDTEFEEEAIEMRSGDILVAFTDGVIEARNPRGEEFGEDRLIDVLTENAESPAAELEKRILLAVEDWTADAEQEDDLTLLILKVR
ncbi:MAG TPA: PP2C family protein-serine/threonine phosphatase, partial [Blastocatellia bacterium]